MPLKTKRLGFQYCNHSGCALRQAQGAHPKEIFFLTKAVPEPVEGPLSMHTHTSFSFTRTLRDRTQERVRGMTRRVDFLFSTDTE